MHTRFIALFLLFALAPFAWPLSTSAQIAIIPGSAVRGADLVREPAADETAAVRWVPLDEAVAMISNGEIVGAGTIIGIQYALMRRAGAQPPAH